MNMASQRLTRSVGTALMVMVVLAGLGAPTAAHGITPEDQTDLLAVTREIILNTAEVGLDEAGTRLLGPTAWRFLKKAATPVFDRLKQQYPMLFGGSGRGTPPVQQQAQAAAQTFKDSQALQAMLLAGFSTLEAGQQEVLSELRLLTVKLEKNNTAISDMDKLNRERHNQILAELRGMREQDRGAAPSEGAVRVLRVVLDDDFRTQQRWKVAPESPTFKSDYGSAGLVLENVSEKWATLYDLKAAGFFIPPIRIELTLQHLGGPPRGWYGLMFGGASNFYENAYTFSITGDGFYMVDKYSDNKQEKMIDLRLEPGLRQGVGAENTLRVDLIGRTITYYVNGTRLGSYAANEDARGYIGVYLNLPQQKALLRRLRVSVLEP